MFIQNDDFKLRAPEPEDLECLYTWENMPEYWTTGNTRQPWSRFALKHYISQTSSDIYSKGNLRLMIEEKKTGIAVGTVDLFDFDIHHSRIAFGLFVAPEFQRKGIANQALAMLQQYVFGFLKVNQLYCIISTCNIASMSMFENKNFSKTILKSWINGEKGFEDVAIFQQFRSDYLSKNQGT